ncbi:MAG: peptidase M16 [Candidatus Aminicenantes bacterium]|nr:peptidase M16 [Candidatus Aminicenantes bacterium]
MNKILKSKYKLLILGLFLLFVFGDFPGLSQEKKRLSLPIKQFKLENGLQVILSEDYSLPIVSVAVAYNVGSINERPGKTGLAYLLENLMLQGSQNVSRMQHISFIRRTGGDLNANTTEDKTIFQQTVPSHQLALVLWLESDRMKSLEITAANVEQAKEAIIEEIHQRKANEPYFESFLSFDEILYPNFAYSHPVIGDEADVRGLTAEDVKDFYATFYKPNNAVLSIAGNIDKAKAEEDIRKYFSTIQKGQSIPLPPSSSPSDKEEPMTVKEFLVPLPGFHIGYKIASPYSQDFYFLKIIEYILLRGITSRLYNKLIKRSRIARTLSGSIEKRKELATFKIFVSSSNEIMAEKSKRVVFSEINKLKSSLVSEKELSKAKNIFKMDYLNQYATSADKAVFLAKAFLAKKSLDDLPDELENYLAVDHYGLIRIMRRYFTNELVLDVKKK